MFPFNDTEPNRYIRFPFMVVAIIAVNVLVMGYEIYLMFQSDAAYLSFVYCYGMIPADLLAGQGAGAITAVTQMFIHAGLLHLFGNMLGLWVYGRRVEDACGHWRFLLFYLTAGVIAGVVYSLARAHSAIPGIGASGAIFGVMGAYLILYPGGRIRTLIFLWIVPIVPKIRAYWLILYFFALQLLPAADTLLNDTHYGVAHWAHLGGFIGSLVIFFFLRPDAFHRYRNDMAL